MRLAPRAPLLSRPPPPRPPPPPPPVWKPVSQLLSYFNQRETINHHHVSCFIQRGNISKIDIKIGTSICCNVLLKTYILEMHQTVLNHILRQSTTHLADGPFAVLVDHTRFLDFDVKRRYFRQELERLNEGAMRRDDLSIHVRREHVFEDSYRELHRRSPDEMKSRLYVVFEGEEGQDAGGLLREWFIIMSREMFNPNYALFRVSPGDRVTYLPNPSSHCNSNHLSYLHAEPFTITNCWMLTLPALSINTYWERRLRFRTWNQRITAFIKD